MDTFGLFLIALAMVVGILGTVVPLLPGLPIVWAAALVYGVVEGFGEDVHLAVTIVQWGRDDLIVRRAADDA